VSLLCPAFVDTGISRSDRSRPESLRDTNPQAEKYARMVRLIRAELNAAPPVLWTVYGRSHDAVSAFIGRVNCNVAPWGTFAVAQSRPPWASMIERQIESPIPMPLGDQGHVAGPTMRQFLGMAG
jgi:hypothetical protein